MLQTPGDAVDDGEPKIGVQSDGLVLNHGVNMQAQETGS